MPNYIDTPRYVIASEARDDAKLRKRNLLPKNTILSSCHSHSGNITDLYKLVGKESITRVQEIIRQDFDVCKDTYLKNQQLFEDRKFPANNSSLGTRKSPDGISEIKWLRPKEILRGTRDEPQFFVAGPSRFDIKQCAVGDCWFLAAVANLAMREDLLNHVVPKDQSFQDDYAGIFKFRFWQYGKWVDVVVDDYLPTFVMEEEIKLYSLHSATKNEFWTALLEKAYAKLHGSYQALEGGWMSEAMEDFTGGVSELYFADSKRPVNLYAILTEAWQKKSLIGCSFKAQSDLNFDENEVDGESAEDETPAGLIQAHAYSITFVTEVTRVEDEVKIPLVRIRNPWGDEHEWKGAWSDGSKKWNSISQEEKKRLNLESEDDGEFWMSLKDFERCYNCIEICHLNLNEFSRSTNKREWEISEFEGAWVTGATAGGCKCDPETFSYNPQYRMTLEKESTVIVALMQKNRRTKEVHDFCKIGFSIYPLEDNPSKKLEQPLTDEFFKNAKAMDIDVHMSEKTAPQSLQYAAGHREISCRLKLTPGVYWIVPNALKDDVEEEFLLRVFTDNPSNVEEYDQKLRVAADEDVEMNDDEDETNLPLSDMVKKLARGDKILDWTECKILLDYMIFGESYDGPGFSERVCKSIVAMLGKNGSGTLDLNKLQTFWKRMPTLKKVFNYICESTGGDGCIKANFLRPALNEAGYYLDNHTLCKLVRRYRTDKGGIKLDDFFMCAIEVGKKFTESPK